MSAPADAPLPAAPERWSRARWAAFVVLAFLGYVAFIFAAGDRRKTVTRPVTNVPMLRISTGPNELIALTDPTLFALPHQHDFAALAWQNAPAAVQPSFRWSESPRWLSLPENELGANFRNFMETNVVPAAPLRFKPRPEFASPIAPVPPAVADVSTLAIAGDLRNRELLSSVTPPAVPDDDTIGPTEVQALVDPAGVVLSVTLLETSGLDAADAQGLKLAARLRFAPATASTLGRVIFDWHTVPVPPTNAPTTSP